MKKTLSITFTFHGVVAQPKPKPQSLLKLGPEKLLVLLLGCFQHLRFNLEMNA